MDPDFRELVDPDPTPAGPGAPSALIPPGPSPEWTARGVIESLEPLTTTARRERLRRTLDSRLDAVSLIFDNNHKAHNGSAVIRSCDAFGLQRAHFIREPAVFGDSKMMISKMVSKGSHRWVDVIEHKTPESAVMALKRSGHQLLVTHPKGRCLPRDLASLERVAIVLGNERDGVGKVLSDAADDTVRIPMRGFVESLNVSVTAAILLQAATEGRTGDLSPEERENVYARWLRASVPRADEVLREIAAY